MLDDGSEFNCEHSERCGGCAFMGTPLRDQLKHKSARVGAALSPYSRLAALAIADTRAADPMLEYRTRAKLVVSDSGAIGLYARHTHDVVDIPGCRVLHPALARVAAWLRARRAPIHALDLRWVERDRGVLVTLSGEPRDVERLRTLAQVLGAETDVIGVALRLQPRAAVQQLEGVPENVAGRSIARDTLLEGGPYHYASHGSFVQAHRAQAAVLAERAIASLEAALSGLRGRTILELFAGSGALGLALCQRGAQVTVVERYAPALEHALLAAREQNTIGLAAISGDADRVLEELIDRGARFDGLIIDPPRRGLSPHLRARIAALRPQAIVYVSCEPTTLARDLDDFALRGLRARGVESFDMMPLAFDVESLVLLQPTAPAAIQVIHEDERLLVVDKPPHLPTIPEAEYAHSLLLRLQEERALPELSALHRLDVGTSGVCLFAKSRAHVEALASQLARSQKHYAALVRGGLNAKGIVRAPLREQGKTRDAISRYTKVERIGRHSLARVRPEQGRTHQVRKHMASIGHPVLGDARYGDPASNQFFEHKHGLQRTFLHASRIEWRDGAGQLERVFEAELAPDLSAVLASLRANDRRGR
ncbi:MAG TPA: pseudouridine synthase [Polyangiales bacterium]|jgi:23S rRNA (uracil1939-C5)-methyltransferase